MQWLKEKVRKDKQRSTQHTRKTTTKNRWLAHVLRKSRQFLLN